MKPTSAGWPRRDHWCVWVQPVLEQGPAALWAERWHQAVQSALATWQQHLRITLVSDPAQAQVRVERRRPPLLNRRASNGRAILELQQVQRGQGWQLEPKVSVLISPGQAQRAIEATSLHELGHAFGLWGHSDQAGDAMAIKPGPTPILKLSARDQRTLRWLQQQPGLNPAPSP
ncbi:MAG: peptidase [Cyanobacteria bacterium M_surface_10_m1_298]|nr:peptidase [Cyanobacteria bacterium M_surface_10_m1_298]